MFKDVQCPTWEKFTRWADTLAGAQLGIAARFLFRGHAANEWDLTPGLRRVLPSSLSADRMLEIERAAVTRFIQLAHHHGINHLRNPNREPFIADTLCAMRHYGAPTRLLDWSASIYVACYFAVESLPEAPGAVYFIDASVVQARVQRELPEKRMAEVKINSVEAPDEIVVINSSLPTQREIAQRGFFTLPLNISGDQEALLVRALSESTTSAGNHRALRLIIPAKQKTVFLSHLRQMNVTPDSLFPGLDGIGRSIRDMFIIGGSEQNIETAPPPTESEDVGERTK